MILKRFLVVAMLASAVGRCADATNCTASCPKNRIAQLNPNSPEVRNAQIQAIKMKILRHLGSHHASNGEMDPNRSREALALLAADTIGTGENLQNVFTEQNEYEEASRMVIFADQDVSCPTNPRDDDLLCLRFDTSKMVHSGSIVRAEISIFFPSGQNESFHLREVRKNLSTGPRIAGASSGGWVRFDATPLVARWTKDHLLDGSKVSSTRIVHLACPTCTNGTLTQIRDAGESPFLFIIVSPAKINRRLKRSVDCSMSNMQKGCCRAPFEVNFHDDIGWKWIIMPQTFTPNFCRGQCELEVNMLGPHGLAKNSYMKAYPIRAQNIELAMCCAPKKLQPLTIVYFANKNTLNVTTIPDMIVDECHCT